ncbi:unnamed protein product [Closterium sp. Yama58-4]|nr:unnamed protein product [Closterium sp. Yama58-4]
MLLPALLCHLPSAERAHFTQFKTAKTLGAPPFPFCPLLPLLLLSTFLALSRSALRLPLAGGAATARVRGARELEELAGVVVVAVELAGVVVGVEVGVVVEVGALVAAVEAEAAAASVVGVEEAAVAAVAAAAAVAVVLVGVAARSVAAPVVASVSSSSALVRYRHPSSFTSGTLGGSGLVVLVPVRTSSVLVTALGSSVAARTPLSAASAV